MDDHTLPARRSSLSPWQRWANAPQSLRWRRWLTRIHSWTGLGLGVYVLLLSITGSASVLRPQFHLWAAPRTVPVAGTRLAGDELRAALSRSYPGFEIGDVREGRRPDSVVRLTLTRDGVATDRLFDPYAVRDLGLAYPPVLDLVEWVVKLHDDLLGGERGRVVNGVGATLFFLLALSGVLLWWPGKARWTEHLHTGWPEKTRRFVHRVHVAFGFWALPMVLVWGFTGIYFAFPGAFIAAIELVGGDAQTGRGDVALRTLVGWHFGRFGGMTGRLIWVTIGLIPAVLFVTGFVMWRMRVARRRRAATPLAPSGGAGAPAYATPQSEA